MSNQEKEPHQVIICIRWEVNKRDNLGRMVPSGKSESKLLTFVGDSKEEANEKLNNFLEKMNEFA